MLIAAIELREIGSIGEVIVEGHLQDANKTFVIVTKRRSNSVGKFDEKVAFCGTDIVKFKDDVKSIVKKICDEGYNIIRSKELDTVVKHNDGIPPQPLKDLAVFLSTEVHKTMTSEGYDVGQCAECTVGVKSMGLDNEKMLESITLKLTFIRGKDVEGFYNPIDRDRRF